MSGIWFISYVALWLLVLGSGVVILILAREIEALHVRLETLERWKRLPENGRVSQNQSNRSLQVPEP